MTEPHDPEFNLQDWMDSAFDLVQRMDEFLARLAFSTTTDPKS